MTNDAGKAERLFRAAISAFCSLTRPSRRDATQLDDLTLPLFDMVSLDTRRYVAAALSECEIAPMELVRRLCDGPVDVAAPLLIRSKALSDVELVAMIGKHGLTHARAIARRPLLNEAIANLARALEGSACATPFTGELPAPAAASVDTEESLDAVTARSAQGIEAVRESLREMMQPASDDYEGATLRAHDEPLCFARLRETALNGNPSIFQTALADVLKLNFRAARKLTETPSYSALLAALRSLELNEEQSFLIVSAVFPMQFTNPEAIWLFLERYRALELETARERVRGWQLDMVASWIKEKVHAPNAENGNEDTEAETPLRITA